MKPLVIQCQSPTPVGRLPKAPSSKIDPISNSLYKTGIPVDTISMVARDSLDTHLTQFCSSLSSSIMPPRGLTLSAYTQLPSQHSKPAFAKCILYAFLRSVLNMA